MQPNLQKSKLSPPNSFITHAPTVCVCGAQLSACDLCWFYYLIQDPVVQTIHVKLAYIEGWPASNIYPTEDMKAIGVESYQIFSIVEGRKCYLPMTVCTCSATSKTMQTPFLKLNLVRERLRTCMFLYHGGMAFFLSLSCHACDLNLSYVLTLLMIAFESIIMYAQF